MFENNNTTDDAVIDLTFITNIPTPYKRPRLNAIANHKDVNLVVYYASKSTSRHSFEHLPKADFDFIIANSNIVSVFGKTEIILNGWSLKYILQHDPDAYIVGGWNYNAAWIGLIAAKLKNKPIGIVSSTSSQDPVSRKISSEFLKYFDSYYTLSESAKKNFISMGIDDADITILPNAIDVHKFQDSLSKERQEKIREQFGLPKSGIGLYVGNIQHIKGVDTLIKASSKSEELNHLLIVGDGNKREKMEELAKEIDSVPITFTGQIPNSELSNYYAISDVFILPTRGDTWGLVVNEAMACGTPVISTTEAGVSGELLRHNENGVIIPPDNGVILAESIDRILSDDMYRKQLANTSIEHSKKYTPQKYASRLLDVVKSTISND